jgi:TrmH family RNA methyltransferase
MTHGRASDEYNMVRAPITPRQLSDKLLETGWKERKIGIVFGPEGEGLSPEMLRTADIAVSIPTIPKNPSMNLAQSVTVMLYELSMLSGKRGKITEKFKPMVATERDVILKLADDCLDQMTWPNPKRKMTQQLIWRRMIGRAMLTRREAATVMGFLKRVRDKK